MPAPATTAAERIKQAAALAAGPAKPRTPRDHAREFLETVVFVVVLVFLLKQFVIEAFVIPTGSMAETLYGSQKTITCDECQFVFPLNSSCEVDPQQGQAPRAVLGYTCPNCRHQSQAVPVHNGSGDRVLVHKASMHLEPLRAGDVVVFKYPSNPQIKFSAQNYIKRLWGVGGDTIAIWRGDLYRHTSIDYPADAYPRPTKPTDGWTTDFVYHNADPALEAFAAGRAKGFPAGGGFEMLRKADDVAMAMRRIVWDNDKPSRTLAGKGVPPRWREETADWASDDRLTPKTFTHTGAGLGWVRYRHLPADWAALSRPKPELPAPQVVDNFMGYNAETSAAGNLVLDHGAEDYKFWVGDLMLECRAEITDPAAELTLELSKGENRFQATFAGGKLTLTRTGPGGGPMGTWPVPVTGPGSYDLRFANIDCRLRVWVNGTRIDLGDKADYPPAVPKDFDPADGKREGWTTANDVNQPAGVGATGGVTVSKLKLWRDSYFLGGYAGGLRSYREVSDVSADVQTYFVQPDHYLCLGDNSAQSSDGRAWGLVPDRLMLGKAMFVFFPVDRIGFIR